MLAIRNIRFQPYCCIAIYDPENLEHDAPTYPPQTRWLPTDSR